MRICCNYVAFRATLCNMVAKNELFATVLRENNYSITSSRRAVFEALDDKKPCTMYELVERCKNIDRASVYRSIALFETLGITRRLYTGWKYKIELSDIFGHHHHHATCIHCGRLFPLDEDPAVESALEKLASQHSFIVKSHEIELSVLCKKCQLTAVRAQKR